MALYGSLWTLIYIGKNNGNIPKQLKFLIKYIALELWFTMEKLRVVLYNVKKKLLYYGKNYDTIPKTIEPCLSTGKNLVL